MALKPWYKIVEPREDLRECGPLGAWRSSADFAPLKQRRADGVLARKKGLGF